MQFIVAKALGLVIDARNQQDPLIAKNSYDLHARTNVGDRYLYRMRCDKHTPEVDCRVYNDEYFACFGIAANRARARRYNYNTLHITYHIWNHLYDPTDAALMKIGTLHIAGPIEPIEITGVDIDLVSLGDDYPIDDTQRIIRRDSQPLKIHLIHSPTPRVTSYGHVTLLIQVGMGATDAAPTTSYDLSQIEAKSVTVWLIKSWFNRLDVVLTGNLPGSHIRSNHQGVKVTLNGESVTPVFDPSIGFFVWLWIEN